MADDPRLQRGINNGGDDASSLRFVWRHDHFGRQRPEGSPERTRSAMPGGPRPGVPARRRHVLVMLVDDDASNREAVHLALPRAFELIALPNGAEFMGMVEAYEPDLVILDLQMPPQSGFRLCQGLRDHPEFRHIPVLFLTDIKEAGDFHKMIEARGDAYLSKPFDAAAFLDTIERLVGSRPRG